MQSSCEKEMNNAQESTLQTSVAQKCYPPTYRESWDFLSAPSSMVCLDFCLDMTDPGLTNCVSFCPHCEVCFCLVLIPSVWLCLPDLWPVISRGQRSWHLHGCHCLFFYMSPGKHCVSSGAQGESGSQSFSVSLVACMSLSPTLWQSGAQWSQLEQKAPETVFSGARSEVYTENWQAFCLAPDSPCVEWSYIIATVPNNLMWPLSQTNLCLVGTSPPVGHLHAVSPGQMW